MSEQKLTKELKEAIIDYFEGWELVDYLQIPIEELVELLEEDITDSLNEIKDFIGFDPESVEDDE